jgi:hypothetical protein
LNHARRPSSCLSMIFSEKPVPTFPDHALGGLQPGIASKAFYDISRT